MRAKVVNMSLGKKNQSKLSNAIFYLCTSDKKNFGGVFLRKVYPFKSGVLNARHNDD